MPNCCDNDVRWSHGQPFTFILDLSDGTYDVTNFVDAQMVYQVAVDVNGLTTTHHVVWRLIKAILDSPKKGEVTAILQASDPGLSATGHGIGSSTKGSAGGKKIIDSVSGPVATFVAPNPIQGASVAGGSSGSSAGAFAPVTTVQIAFDLAHPNPTKV